MNAHDVPGSTLVLRGVQHRTQHLTRSLTIIAGVISMSLLTLLVPLYSGWLDQGEQLSGTNHGAFSTGDLCTVWTGSDVTARPAVFDPELADDGSDFIWVLSAEDSMDGRSNVVNISAPQAQATHAHRFSDTASIEAVHSSGTEIGWGVWMAISLVYGICLLIGNRIRIRNRSSAQSAR